MENELRSVILNMLSLALISAGLAFAANKYGPRRIPWVQDWAHHIEQLAQSAGIEVIPLFEVARAVSDNSALFVDARPEDKFSTGHIPGAVNVPRGDADAQMRLMERLIENQQPMIVYCDGQTCDDALNLCRELKANGYENLRLFADGIEMWRRFKWPLEKGAEQ
ncbi:rhodanese-like domain-containing protein [Verrucomicrobiota bacterium]